MTGVLKISPKIRRFRRLQNTRQKAAFGRLLARSGSLLSNIIQTSRKCPEIPGKCTKANSDSDIESVQLSSSNCKNPLKRVRLSVLEIVEKTFLHNNRRCCAVSHKIPPLTKTGLFLYIFLQLLTITLWHRSRNRVNGSNRDPVQNLAHEQAQLSSIMTQPCKMCRSGKHALHLEDLV